jgi:hypothetical protein
MSKPKVETHPNPLKLSLVCLRAFKTTLHFEALVAQLTDLQILQVTGK